MENLPPSFEQVSRENKSHSLKTPPKFLVIGVVLLVLIMAGVLLFKPANKAAKRGATKTPTATTSAKTTSTTCPDRPDATLYKNAKQGYSVCYLSSWKQGDLQVSSLTVGFDPTAVSSSTVPALEVFINEMSVDLNLQNSQDSSSKFEFGKETVGKVEGSQITYTRMKDDPIQTYTNVIDTIVHHFGRTYVIRLNTNEATKEADTKIYNDFLTSWKFLPDTADPPWSNSRSILVYSPWTADLVGSSISLSGQAVAFEGVVNVRVKDKAGHTLLSTTVQTQNGTELSPFSANLTFDKPTTKDGTVEVFTSSPKDGSEQDKVTIPVFFE